MTHENDLASRLRRLEQQMARVEQALRLEPLVDVPATVAESRAFPQGAGSVVAWQESHETGGAIPLAPIVPVASVAPDERGWVPEGAPVRQIWSPPPTSVESLESVELLESAASAENAVDVSPRRAVPPPLPFDAPRAMPATNPPLVPPSLQPLAREVLPYNAPPLKPKLPAKQGNLEQAIGLKWAGWIGAVVLLIGAALGVKYAYDQQWFAQLPIWVWPSIIAACGFALIGAGEWVYRRINVIPAASLFGAGVATLFLVSYIGHSFYGIYSPGTAFILMALTTVIGSAIAMRGKLVSIAVLSLIGGNVAPLVMGDQGQPHTPFMTYLLMLQVIALSVAWWGQSARWWALRGLSLATTTLWMIGIVASERNGLRPLWFSIGFALLYHAEVILSALRIDRDPAKAIKLRHGGSVFLTLVNAGLTIAILAVLKDLTPWTRAGSLIAFSIACAIAGFAARATKRTLTASLAPSYAASAAALLTLAVPIAFDGRAVEFGWATLAIIMAFVGRQVRSKAAQAGSVATWLLALMHVVLTSPTVDAFRTHPAPQLWLTILGVEIFTTTAFAWGLAMVGHAIAALLQEKDSESQSAARLQSAAATTVFVATSLVSLPPIGASFCLIAYAWLMLAEDRALPRLRLAMHAVVVLLLTTVKWIAVDTLSQRLSPDWSAAQYAPVVNPLMGVGLLLAGSLVGVYWLRRGSLARSMPEKGTAPLAAVVAMGAVALLAIAFSFEIDRIVERALLAGQTLAWPAWQVKHLAWTMLWSASAVLLAFVISRLSALGDLRVLWIRAIAVVASLLVAKFIFIDTLWFRMDASGATAQFLFNLQTLAALVVVGAVVLIAMLQRSAKPQAAEEKASQGVGLLILALFVVAWTGSFELERYILLHPAIVSPWPLGQFKQMAWTMWWTICAVGGFVIGKRFDRDASPRAPWARVLPVIVMLLAVKFMVLDALVSRLLSGVTLAPVVGNIQMLCAAVILGALFLLMSLGLPGASEFSRSMRVRCGSIAAILALLAISLEIDRFFEGPRAAGMFTDPRLAKQVGFSIVWSLFAVMCVAVGFRIRLAGLRYFGLALLALTLLKVVTVDLGQVSTGYRILSFLGLGLFLLGTSVLYGIVSPKLLKTNEQTSNVE